MARTRLIRPAFFKHGELYDAERASGLPLRVAFAGLWTVADKPDGRFAWKPRDIKADVLPHDDVDFGDVLDALHRSGFIASYVVDGKRYGYIPSFSTHQTFHKSEVASKLPPPPDTAPVTDRPPIDPGENREDAVAVAVTGTDADKLRAEGDAVREYALALTAKANAAARQKWRAEPWMAGSVPSFTMSEELITAGVPLPDAQQRLVTQIESSGMPNPPRSLRYFLPGCLEANAASPRPRRGKAPPQQFDYTPTEGDVLWAK